MTIQGCSKHRIFYRQVAHLHAVGINQGFLSTLGEPFLAMLYETIDEDPSCVLIVYEREGKIVGFVSGAESLRSVYRRLLKRLPKLVWTLLPVLFSFKKIIKLIELLLHNRKDKSIEGAPRPELLSIVVASDQRGSGIAEQLYRSLCKRFADQGKSNFCIVVGDALAPAHRFYKKMGAEPIGHIEVHSGQGSVVYRQVC